MELSKIKVFDFKNQRVIEEKVPGESVLRLLYQNDTYSALTLQRLMCKNSLVSRFISWLMKSPWSKRSIRDFVRDYGVKLGDFQDVDYKSFNDFFIRKLRCDARMLSKEDIIVPCDGRHLFYQNTADIKGIYVKGQMFSVQELIPDQNIASLYKQGIMIISRLAPVDYHRFHFPIDCTVKNIRKIKGTLHSVNPIALKQRLKNIIENKKVFIELESAEYGNVLMIAVGATHVGSINIAAKQSKRYKKGDELGYFSFGGSMIITLFQNDMLTIDKKLIEYTDNQMEVLLNMGISLTNCE